MGIIALIAVIVIALVFAFLYKPSQQQQDMAPATLDSFQVTLANEATVVSVFYGQVRKRGNIIYYGNLITEAITQQVGGKGGGEETAVVGFKYYLDVWQAIGMGKASIVQTWIQDAGEEVVASATLFNDGTQDIFPTQPGENANRLKGVCHVFYDRMYLGDNMTYVPTIHFLMLRDMSISPVSYAVMAKGTNPAAIIYDMLILGGESPANIDLAKFNTAALYWYNKGYALNIDMTSQAKVKEKIGHVLTYVDGAFGVDAQNKFYLKAYDENDAATATMETDDFLEFIFTRKSWHQTYNDFRANYTDEDKDYTTRTIVARNNANIRMQGRKKPRSVDLTAYRTLSLASQRLWEIMKKESYPDGQISCKTTMKFAEVLVGDVIEITNTEYSMSSVEYRVINKDVTEIDQNKLGFRMIQMIETLFDDNFQTAGGPGWITPDYSPDTLVKQRVFEMPYNPLKLHGRAYLLLAARANSHDTGFVAMTSNTGVDYVVQGSFSTWAQYGTLSVQYPSTTYEIDDEVGIIYTPYREDPVFASISRTDLFSRQRFVLIGDELMRFQAVSAYESNKIRLTGIVRNVLNTTRATHNVSAPVWVFELGTNIMTGITSDDFYVKMLPFFLSEVVDPAVASPVHVIPTDLASIPWAPYRVVVTRSGSSCTAEWWPTNQDTLGAGNAAPSQLDSDPMLFDQDFDTRYNGANDLVVVGTTRAYTQAGSHTFQVRSRLSGQQSAYVNVTVGAGDGSYYGGW